MTDERMDVEGQVEKLNAALSLQHRSVLQYLLAAGTVTGLQFQAHSDKLRGFAVAELEDAGRLVEKITSFGGEPTTNVAPSSSAGTPTRPWIG
jgi:bacterioferritin (cytochrome b1)